MKLISKALGLFAIIAMAAMAFHGKPKRQPAAGGSGERRITSTADPPRAASHTGQSKTTQNILIEVCVALTRLHPMARTLQKGGERMSPAATVTDSQPLILHLGPLLEKMSDHEFFTFCQLNPDWRIERTSAGDLVIMPPTGGWTGARNFTLIGIFSQWVEADGTGLGFDSSTGFTLPNGAKRSPDLAWVTRARWAALTAEEQEEFPPLCPDFVVELRSRSDDLATLQAKMQEYLANGAQLGWLIDPQEKKVYIYRPHDDVRCIENPMTISGEPVLPGFSFNVQRLWS